MWAREANNMAVDSKRRLLDLQQKPGNDTCADCSAKDPQWASFNIGVFLCEQCAGIHRSLGAHISKVKSITLDNWDEAQLEHMANTGNDIAKQKYEQHVPLSYRRPKYGDPHVLREQWILGKYARQEFIDPERQPYLAHKKEGYLYKLGKEDKKYNKRRFELSLEEGTLKYYNNEKKTDPKAILRLDDMNITLVPEKMNNPNGVQILFEQGQDRSTRNIFLYAQSSMEIIEWYTAIRNARLNRLRIAYPGKDDKTLVPLLSADFLKEGWLLKTGPKTGDAYRRRWVSLLKRNMMYYEQPMDAFPKGEVPLGTKERGFTVREGVPPAVKDIGFPFTLKTPTRDFHFSAESDSERREWIEAIQQVLQAPMSIQDSSNAALGLRKRSSMFLFGKA